MTINRTLTLATRGSRLALAQAQLVVDLLRQAWPGLEVKMSTIATHGDLNRAVPLADLVAPDGVFTRGVEAELLAGRADLAVHSLKDVPTSLDARLVLAAFPPRGEVSDVLISPTGLSFDRLPAGATIGTSSPRRQAQTLAARPDLRVASIRGNIDTRLGKLRAGEADALILAAVGLERLALDHLPPRPLSLDQFLPAVGQGALVVQCRADDLETRDLLSAIDDRDTRAAVEAERAFLRAVGGGCRVPVAGLGRLVDGQLELRGFISAPDGSESRSAVVSGAVGDPATVGLALAERMLALAGSVFWRRFAVAEQAGIVYLVGAGPGDPGLLTRRGATLLRTADVVVYDRLVAPSLLDLCPPTTEKIFVGKEGGGPSVPQQETTSLLIERGRAGQRVVRLKGGDPFVFGRGGEEALDLQRAGLAFEIVPGVTSAIAAPAYAGIPVTHRGLASSVTFATGHEDPTKPESSLDWSRLARGGDTLVFLMGVEHLETIAERLIAAGREPAEPAALVRWGTTAQQRTLRAPLAQIATLAREQDFRPPAVLVVGAVVGLADDLAWFERRPLFGRRVLVTRAREQASALSKQLQELGAEPIEFPTIRIEPLAELGSLDAAVQRLGQADWVILTSANGVRAVFERLTTLGRDARAFAGARVAAIGPATAASLRDHGIQPDFVPTAFTSEAIARELAPLVEPGQRVLLLRADIAPRILADQLALTGATVENVTAYRTLPDLAGREQIVGRLERGEIDVVTFTSSSTVSNFVEALGPARSLLERPLLVSIGPVTSATARELGLRVDLEAAVHTVDGLVQALVDHLSQTGEVTR